MTKKVIRNFGG